MKKISAIRKLRFIMSNPIMAVTAYYIKHFNPSLFPGSVYDPDYDYDGVATCIDPQEEENRRIEWFNSVVMYEIV